jgi:uncharacterized membrane protein YqaE (UPF0057 family)
VGYLELKVEKCSQEIRQYLTFSLSTYKIYSQSNRKVLMNKLIIIVAAVLLPPLAVFLKKGIGKHFFINLVLTLFFFVPGIIHGVWLVTK